MAEYVKVMVSAVGSANSDYTDPHTKYTPSNHTPEPEMSMSYKLPVNTGGTTIDLAPFNATTGCEIIIKNLDSTYYCEVDYTPVYGSATTVATASGLRLLAGRFMILPDVDPAQDLVLTANTANVLVELFISGDAAA
jgi:hypothetical protein